MLYTALDILDAIQLAPDDIVREGTWISMDRSKSGVQIELPVVPQLARILSKVPRPIDSKRPYCAGIIRKNGAEATPKQASKNVSTAIKRAFSTSGKPGYTAKDLRRMLGAILLDQGYSREWIDKALTHAPGSRTTDAYMGVYDETLERAFKDAFGG